MRRCWLLLIFLSIFLFQFRAFAFSSGFEAYSYRPATDDGPYFTVWGTKNIDQFDFSLGTTAVYAYRPLQLTSPAGGRLQGIINNSLIQHFHGHVGLFDQWLSLGLDVPVGLWLKYANPNVAGAGFSNKMAIGDIRLNLKTEFLDVDKYKVGIGLVPFLSIPTGYGRYFMGYSNVSGGGLLTLEAKPFSSWSFSINTGVEVNPKYDLRNMEKKYQYILNAGLALKITKSLSAVAEVSSMTRLTSPYSERVESPVEARGGLKWNVGQSGLVLNLGGSGGIVYGSGVPRYSIFGGLSYSSWKRTKRPSRPLADIQFINDAMVHFATNSVSISDADAEILSKVADILQAKRSINVAVKGHTDNTGTTWYNQKLSKKRAEKVRWYLKTRSGVSDDRLMAIGDGESEPIGTNATPAGRSENRRVDFDASVE